MLNDVCELSMTVCMIVVYVNFIVEKIYKRHVDCTKSVEQFMSEEIFKDKVNAVLCLQQSRTCDMLILLRMKVRVLCYVGGKHECSLQRGWNPL